MMIRLAAQSVIQGAIFQLHNHHGPWFDVPINHLFQYTTSAKNVKASKWVASCILDDSAPTLYAMECFLETDITRVSTLTFFDRCCVRHNGQQFEREISIDCFIFTHRSFAWTSSIVPA